jgi:hypothetical protein
MVSPIESRFELIAVKAPQLKNVAQFDLRFQQTSMTSKPKSFFPKGGG